MRHKITNTYSPPSFTSHKTLSTPFEKKPTNPKNSSQPKNTYTHTHLTRAKSRFRKYYSQPGRKGGRGRRVVGWRHCLHKRGHLPDAAIVQTPVFVVASSDDNRSLDMQLALVSRPCVRLWFFEFSNFRMGAFGFRAVV